MSSRKIALYAAIASAILALIGGINEFIGYFEKIGLLTVGVSLISGVSIMLFLPRYLNRGSGDRQPSRLLRSVTALAGVVIILLGTLPYLINLYLAFHYEGLAKDATLHNYASKSYLYWTKAQKKFSLLDFKKKEMESNLFLAQSNFQLGNSKEAKSLLQEITKSGMQDESSQALLYLVSGNISKLQGDYAEAELNYQRAMSVIEPASNDEGILLLNYGMLNYQKGPNYQAKAFEMTNKAADIFRNHQKRIGETQALLNLAYFNDNKPEKARTLLTQALTKAAGERDMEALIFLNFGVLEKRAGKLEKAKQYYDRARSAYTSMADIDGQANVEFQMAYLEAARANYASALQYLKQAGAFMDNITKSEGITNYAIVAKIYSAKAYMLNETGSYTETEAMYTKALGIYDEHPDVFEEIKTRLNFAAYYQNQGDNVNARKIMSPIEQFVFTELSSSPNQYVTIILNNLGKMYKDNGDLVQAKQFINKSLDMARSIGDRQLEAEALQNLSVIEGYNNAASSANVDTALAIHEQFDNRSARIATIRDIYLRRGHLMTIVHLYDTVDMLLSEANDPRVSRDTKRDILLSIQPGDVSDKSLKSYRDKLLAIKTDPDIVRFKVNNGRCNLSLAMVYARLSDLPSLRSHLEVAEANAASIAYPTNLLYYAKLAFLRFQVSDTSRAIDWLIRRLELTGDQRSSEVLSTLRTTRSVWGTLTREQRAGYLERIKALRNAGFDATSKSYFDEFIALSEK